MKRTILLFLGLLLLGWTSTQAADINLSATNATWKYLDNGTDQGTAWTGAGFDDSAWPSGPAPHGYGTLQIATTNAAGRITYYYRRQITVPAPSAYSNLFLRLRADDGGVVYFNGAEVYRTNMPAGVPAFVTTTPNSLGTVTFYSGTNLPPSVLVAGVNQLAVEIHQFTTNNNDSAFALELIGQEAPCTPPSITTAPQNLTVCAGSSAAFSVVASGTAPLSYQWSLNGAALPGATTSTYTDANAQPADAGTYCVVVSNPCGSVTNCATLTVIQCGPIITSVSPLTAQRGDIIKINGSGFDPERANNCVVRMLGAQNIPLRVVSATSTQLCVLVPPVPAGATSGPIAVLVGKGLESAFIDTIDQGASAVRTAIPFLVASGLLVPGASPLDRMLDLRPGELEPRALPPGEPGAGLLIVSEPEWEPAPPLWVFRGIIGPTNQPGVSAQLVTLIPTPVPPPGSGTNWIFATASGGTVSFTITNDCPFNTRVEIQGDLSYVGADPRAGIDIAIPNLIIQSRLSASNCAAAICRLLVAAFANSGITVNCALTPVPGGAILTISSPTGTFSGAGVMLCFSPAEAGRPQPVITGVEPTDVRSGDLITITGENLPQDPQDACIMIVGANGEQVTLLAEDSTGDTIRARVSGVGAMPVTGTLMLAKGIGRRLSLLNGSNQVFNGTPAWTFTGTGPTAVNTTPITVTWQGLAVSCPTPYIVSTFNAANSQVVLTLTPAQVASLVGAVVSFEGHFAFKCKTPLPANLCSDPTVPLVYKDVYWKSITLSSLSQNNAIADLQTAMDSAFQITSAAAPCSGVPFSINWNGSAFTAEIMPGCDCVLCGGSMKLCIGGVSPVFRIPNITGTTNTQLRTGQRFTVTGTDLGNDPANLCFVIVNTNRLIPLLAVEANDTNATIEVGPIPPDAEPGRIGVAGGFGSMGGFRPVLTGLTVDASAWFFVTTNGGTLSPQIVTPVYVPPPINEVWYHSFRSNGQIYVFLPGPCPPGTKLIMDGHFDISSPTNPVRHTDCWLPAVGYPSGGSAVNCARRVCDSFVCGYYQRTGVKLACSVIPVGNGALICLRFPGGTIVNGCMTVCVRTCTLPPLPTCVTNQMFHFEAGTTTDNFVGPEASSPSANFLAWLANVGANPLKGFDDLAIDHSFAHTFANLPECITSARLTVRMRAQNGGGLEFNDGFHLLFTEAGGTLNATKFSRYIGTGNSGPFLVNQPWVNGTTAIVTLDLANLPGGLDLIPLLCKKRYLDLYIQDDTAIDYAVLDITSCRCRSNLVAWVAPGRTNTVVTFPRPVFTDQCCPNKPLLSVWCVPPSGSLFPLGTSTVHCTGRDALGQRAHCCFQVNAIRDTTPPVVVCPPPTLTVTNCIIPGFTVTATDDCATPAQLTIMQTPPANTPVLPGTYWVTIKVCDPSGNCSYCYVTVIAVGHAAQTRALGLFNTGVNASGGLLPGAAVDSHFALTVSADATAPPPNAEVTSPVGGAWMQNAVSLISQWISPRPDTFVVGEPNGNYTYQSTFNLTGLDPNSAQITGRWAADDTGTLFINGLPVISAPNRLAWTPFSINSGFIAGVNTLELRSQNLGGGPTGVRLEMTGTADDFCVTNRCVPRPRWLGMWLTLDELTGSTVYNSVAGAPNGQHYEGAFPNAGYSFRHIPGVVGYGVRFDGFVDNIQVPDYFNIAVGAGRFSLDGWVRLDVASTTRKIIMEKRGTVAGLERGFSFAVLNNRLLLRLADSVSAQDYVDTGATLNQGQWYFVAVTVQRGVANGIKFYVNGLPTGTATPAQSGNLNVPNPLVVGHSRWLNYPYFPNGIGWRGCLDELELIRRVLSAPQVLALWNAQDAGKCKLRCKVPWDYAFPVGSSTLTGPLMIWNDSGTAQTFNWFAQPSFCGSYAGPTQFSPPAGTVTVPPLGCVTIPITVTRPAGIAAGQTTCFQVVVGNTVTKETTHCDAILFVNDTFNVAPTNSGAVVVATTTNAATATFRLQNVAPMPLTLNLRFMLFDDMMQSNPPAVSLNGLPPGTPLPPFSVTLAAGSGFAPAGDPSGSVTNLTVNVQFDETDPGPAYSLVLEADLTGDGTYTGLTSVTLINMAGDATSTDVPPTLSLTIRREANGQVIVEWPVGPDLQEGTNLGSGDWTDVENAVSPYTATNPPPVRFFRLRLPGLP